MDSIELLNTREFMELLNLGERIIKHGLSESLPYVQKFFGDPFAAGKELHAMRSKIIRNPINTGRTGSIPDPRTKSWTIGKQGRPVQMMKESSNEEQTSKDPYEKDYTDDWRGRVANSLSSSGQPFAPVSDTRKNKKKIIVEKYERK